MTKTANVSQPAGEIRSFRRIVTGHDADGRSTFLSDAVSPHATEFLGVAGFVVTDLWSNSATPATNDSSSQADPCSKPMQIAPPAGGAIFRTTQFPPESSWREPGISGEHPHMHSTSTLDYAIVLEGEIWAVLETGETMLQAGDVLIQRGTRHAWANRSSQPCVIAFVMIDGEALPDARVIV